MAAREQRDGHCLERDRHDFIEWHHDEFTRGQRDAGGLVLSRIDRIYSNHAPSTVLDAKVCAAVKGSVFDRRRTSDHVPVQGSFCMGSQRAGCKQIPRWVTRHDDFPSECALAAERSPLFLPCSPGARLAWAKQIMHNAAN